MPQVSKKFLQKDVEKRMYEVFEKGIADLKKTEDVKNFIADILTSTERVMLSKRLAIAVLLAKGYDYRAIGDILKVSSATINSVIKQHLISGKGYKTVVEKILQNEELQKFFIDLTKNFAKLISHPSRHKRVDSYYNFKKKQLEDLEI